jgi:hypothetical protein
VRAITYSVEIAVGGACLLAVPGAWRSARWLGAVLVAAGLVAVVHGGFALVN